VIRESRINVTLGAGGPSGPLVVDALTAPLEPAHQANTSME
jgi:hypothetical protein